MLGLISSVALNAAAPTSRPDWLVEDPSYETFLTDLQSAVRGNDRKRVVLTSLPLRVNVMRDTFHGRSKFDRTALAILNDYERIFTPQVRRAILKQHANDLFKRDQGAMIGGGEVWFDHTCRHFGYSTSCPIRINAINHWKLGT